jgi:hypothetical protein
VSMNFWIANAAVWFMMLAGWLNLLKGNPYAAFPYFLTAFCILLIGAVMGWIRR